MSEQETKPAETPVEDSEVKVAESDTVLAGAPTKPETTSEVSDVKSDEKAPTTKEATVKEEDGEKANDARPSIKNPPKGMLRTEGRRAAEEDPKKNIKFDPSTLPDTDDPQLIRTQVEFYFSDSNLPSDNHLWTKVGGEENKPVPLSEICSFKRMHRFKPYSAVVAALKDSKFLVVEGEEGSETIRRKHPYDASKRQKVEERSIYAKGFGKEEPSTQFDIEAFFAQYGPFNSVRLRRADNKVFKGSVFVEWADKDTADKFLALDPAPKWKDHPLLILSKQEYMRQKSEDIRNGNKDPNGSRRFQKDSQRGGRGGRGRGRGGFRGDSDDWKKRREEDQKNGFGDRRGGRDQRGRGRGRGRGGRGRDRGGENGRAVKEEPVDDRNVGRPKIHTSSEGAKILEEANGSAGKRAREEEGGGAEGEPPAKKVDQKETVTEAA
ncbi:hypothetical protein DL764_010651 [Monosporascus ibericus]|uniref:HTH La-type RNA-binding domain-containing protein n=1 Tax=Monosporascus ibericus TaxID=155417 RepID=A0A4Q4SSG0_9PEZI|nr:hypothetical protein DL764_010651 [Monosporascus ibericus]